MTAPSQYLTGPELVMPEVWTWFDVRRLMVKEWERGQHVAVLAPTGTGKSYLVTRGLLPMWDHSITIDAKREDPDNIMHRQALGAKLLDRYPPPHIGRLWGEDPYPDKHYWVAPSYGDLTARLDEALSAVFDSAKDRKGWTVYCDEIKLLCAKEPDGHDLSARIIKLLRYGRGRGITFIGGTQSPKYNGPGMGDFVDQPRWKFIGYTADAGVIERYAEISGFPRKVGMQVVPSLGERDWWLLGPHRLSVRFTMPGPRALRRPASSR